MTQKKRRRKRDQDARRSVNTSVRSETAQQPRRALGSRGLWISIALVALIAAIYIPVRHYGFVDLDDPQYVSENPVIANGLTWSGVKWAFTSIHASYWLPLIWLSHMLDVQVYGLNAGAHHITNVLLHSANAILLFVLLHRMTGAVGRSAFVAGLFAVHPLHVESVVWITERKDVLSTLFLLLTIRAYVAYTERPRRGWYLLALAFFVLGLMSKSMVVTLPFMLLLLDVWPLERITLRGWPLSTSQRAAAYRLVMEKLPFFGLAVASAIVTYLAQQRTGAVASVERISLGLRVANATLSYVSYIEKMFWPAGLALFYPYPLALSPLLIAGCALALVAISALVLFKSRTYPYLAVGWLWYLGTLVPVIGIIQAGDQARADRFTYVPLIGLFIIVAWGTWDLMRPSRVAPFAAALALLALSAGARVQVGYWKTNERLWQHALDATTESYIAHTSLGIALFEQGKTDQAISHYRAALRLRPDFAEAYNDLGVALAGRGEIDGAIRAFLDALRAKPGQAASHYNAAVLLAQKGDTTSAVQHLESALQLNGDYADARRELNKLRPNQTR